MITNHFWKCPSCGCALDPRCCTLSETLGWYKKVAEYYENFGPSPLTSGLQIRLLLSYLANGVWTLR